MDKDSRISMLAYTLEIAGHELKFCPGRENLATGIRQLTKQMFNTIQEISDPGCWTFDRMALCANMRVLNGGSTVMRIRLPVAFVSDHYCEGIKNGGVIDTRFKFKYYPVAAESDQTIYDAGTLAEIGSALADYERNLEYRREFKLEIAEELDAVIRCDSAAASGIASQIMRKFQAYEFEIAVDEKFRRIAGMSITFNLLCADAKASLIADEDNMTAMIALVLHWMIIVMPKCMIVAGWHRMVNFIRGFGSRREV